MKKKRETYVYDSGEGVSAENKKRVSGFERVEIREGDHVMSLVEEKRWNVVVFSVDDAIDEVDE